MTPRSRCSGCVRPRTLDLKNAAVQAELGYTLERMGRDNDARLAFERAAALDPANINIQSELGFLYWRTGNVLMAERALERAWQADQRNITVAEQLVYVEQRLTHNPQARRYAEHVLDAYQGRGEGAADAQKQFGLKRLHEDLGRRVTISADGWSGTRVGTGTSASRAGDGFRSYSQIEGEVRLGRASIHDGKTIAVYARLIGDSGIERRAVPVQNRTAVSVCAGSRSGSRCSTWRPSSRPGSMVPRGRTRWPVRAHRCSTAGITATTGTPQAAAGSRRISIWTSRTTSGRNTAPPRPTIARAITRKLASGHSVEPYAHVQ
jgi:hypothetical protein